LIFLAAAPSHFTNEGIAHAAELGAPFANLLVPISGILAIAGGLSVATGFHAKFGYLALTLFLVPVTLGMHQFWTIEAAAHRSRSNPASRVHTVRERTAPAIDIRGLPF
jgi:putative oxidoreductase